MMSNLLLWTRYILKKFYDYESILGSYGFLNSLKLKFTRHALEEKN